MNNKLLIQVDNLSIRFRVEDNFVDAVQNISFDLHEGEILGIVGESGSGKSVTSLGILGLLDPNVTSFPTGSIKYFQGDQFEELLQFRPEQFRSLRGSNFSMIFQEPMTSLNPVYTCGNQVAESLMLHKKMNPDQARQKTIELFEEVELPRPDKIFEAYPHQLSGGQKQRVMIAMAISCEPKLLIADEPTTALDVTVQKEIVQLIKKLRDKNGMAVIFISHDLGLVAEISDSIAVMQKGKLVEKNTVIEIFENPEHPYSKGLIHCKPKLSTHFHRLPTVSDFVITDDQGKLLDVSPDMNKFGSQEKRKTDPEVVLEIKNLNTWYPIKRSLFGKTLEYVKAVQDVNISLHKGETLGLVGESGCGKSTIGNTIMGISQATSGEIWFEGRNILTQNKEQWKLFRQKVQLIFQDPYSSLNPRKNIREIICEPMLVNGIGNSQKDRIDRAVNLLETVGLNADHLKRLPHEFSGGQRQRICIARTLALEPKIIICDESVSALDVSVQAQVLNLLNDLKDQFQLSYIFVSHDLSVVKYMADNLVVMKEGRIEEYGNSDQIYKKPQSEYTRKLIEAIPMG